MSRVGLLLVFAVAYFLQIGSAQNNCLDTYNQRNDPCRIACFKESGVTADMIKQAKEGSKLDEIPSLKNFLLCYMKKLDTIDDAGEILVDNIKNLIGSVYGEENAQKYTDDCVQKGTGTGEEKAIQIGKCYLKYILKSQ